MNRPRPRSLALFLLPFPFLFAGCDGRDTASPLDGVYHQFGGYESETIVLRGDTFEWWFSWDEPLPDIFPLRGRFSKVGNRLELVYEIPEEQQFESGLVSPPRFLELVEHPSPLIRSHRFFYEDFKESRSESREAFEAGQHQETLLLFKTILRPGDELSGLNSVLTFEDRESVVADQRARFKKAFDFMQWDEYERYRTQGGSGEP